MGGATETAAWRVAVASRINGLLEALQSHASAANMTVAWTVVPLDGPTEHVADALVDAEIVLADPPAVVAHLPVCEQLRWMHSTFAGPRIGEPRMPPS